MLSLRRRISLRAWSGLLLALAAVITFFIVGSVLLLYRVPQLETVQRGQMQQRAEGVANLLGYYTGGVEAQLMAVAAMSRTHLPRDMQAYLEAVVSDGSLFEVAFLVDHAGKVQGVGLPENFRQAASILRGTDFAFNPLFHTAHHALQQSAGAPVAVWSDRYLSVLSGKNTVGVAVATPERIVVGEVSLERILDMLSSSAGTSDSLVTIVDGRGQWLSSSNAEAPGRHFNFATLPAFVATLRGQPLPADELFLGERQVVGGVLSKKLHWVILATSPTGLADTRTRMLVLWVVYGFFGALLVSLALSPYAALIVSRRVQPLIDYSRRIANGDYPSDWPPGGYIRELEQLSHDLQRMVGAMRSRESALRQNERKLETIFHASPTAMLVADLGQGSRIIDVNAAWEQQFKRSRSEVIGLSAELLGMWVDEADEQRFSAELRRAHLVADMEAWLYRGDGQPRLVRLAARTARIGKAFLLLVTLVDITEQRRIEREVLELNADLEQRVVVRTEELSQANAALAASLEDQRAMQAQLVQSEKNAALGGMVAGVAHELNTPVGNALMAATTMHQGVLDFRAKMAQGLRRSELVAFLDLIAGASEIAERNLHRAADLVGSFKQVAVDQVSDQRRRFDLSEVVREIVLTLQPSLRCTPFLVSNEIVPGYELDSYPGALGQVLTNLINNAVLHGLSGRESGCVRLTASDVGSVVEVSVSDDGCGISPEVQKHIFEPFFTSRRGLGGTGLGLHICQNMVSRVLGGTISVFSVVGSGTTVTLRLPRIAPLRASSAEDA